MTVTQEPRLPATCGRSYGKIIKNSEHEVMTRDLRAKLGRRECRIDFRRWEKNCAIKCCNEFFSLRWRKLPWGGFEVRSRPYKDPRLILFLFIRRFYNYDSFSHETFINMQWRTSWTAPIIAIHVHLIKHQQIHVKLIRNRNWCFCFEVDVKIASDGPHIVLSNTPSSAFSAALESLPTSFRVKWVAEINQSERYRVAANGASPILSLFLRFQFCNKFN